jgi:hypothetical protein
MVPNPRRPPRDTTISLRCLREAVAGRDTTISRSQAMALLVASGFPNAHRDLASVLQNEQETVGIRVLAAAHLGRIATRAAVEILMRSTHIRDQRILAVIMTTLGRIGDRSALDLVLNVKEQVTGVASTQAAFAAKLLSHRLGLRENGSEWPAPDDGEYLELPDGAAFPLHIARADGDDAEDCLRSLATRPFGIEFDERTVHSIRRWHHVSLLLFNRDVIGEGAAARLLEQTAFLGVIADKDQEIEQYAVTNLILTSPTNQRDRITVQFCRPHGELTLAGTAHVAGTAVEFLVRSIRGPGARPTWIQGTFDDGRLQMLKAVTTTFVAHKRQPVEGLRP